MAGLGKTYAVEQALTRAGKGSVCWAAFPSRPTMRSGLQPLIAGHS